MSGQACPLPVPPASSQTEMIQRMLAAKRVAVFGLSDDPSRPSHDIAQYLIRVGKDVVGVNPKHTEVLGKPCYPTLKDVPGKIDVVNVFRRPGYCAEVVRQAIEIGAKGVWLQSGIRNEEARQLAARAGLDYIEDRCIMVDDRMSKR
jgi:uncharacterized protein